MVLEQEMVYLKSAIMIPRRYRHLGHLEGKVEAEASLDGVPVRDEAMCLILVMVATRIERSRIDPAPGQGSFLANSSALNQWVICVGKVGQTYPYRRRPSDSTCHSILPEKDVVLSPMVVTSSFPLSLVFRPQTSRSSPRFQC